MKDHESGEETENRKYTSAGRTHDKLRTVDNTELKSPSVDKMSWKWWIAELVDLKMPVEGQIQPVALLPSSSKFVWHLCNKAVMT